MYFICKAVDMAPQPIRCLWSGDNKHLKKKKKKKKKSINHGMWKAGRKERHFLFNDTLDTF